MGDTGEVGRISPPDVVSGSPARTSTRRPQRAPSVAPDPVSSSRTADALTLRYQRDRVRHVPHIGRCSNGIPAPRGRPAIVAHTSAHPADQPSRCRGGFRPR